jgi:hypothetical protein
MPAKTTITSLTANSGSSFTVKWNKKSTVKGYQIRYSTDSSFKTKKTASTTLAVHTRKNLAKGIYYVSVRTYNIAADGTKYYSAWSATKRVVLEPKTKDIADFLSMNVQQAGTALGWKRVKNYGGNALALDNDKSSTTLLLA